jgi:hypothetical protein
MTIVKGSPAASSVPAVQGCRNLLSIISVAIIPFRGPLGRPLLFFASRHACLHEHTFYRLDLAGHRTSLVFLIIASFEISS